MPCLACYSHYLNTYTCNIWGHLHCLVLEKKQNKDFSKKGLKSCNVAQAEQSRGETTRVAFLPSHPPKYLPAHLTRQKLLPDHILAPTLTLTVWRTCSTRQPIFAIWGSIGAFRQNLIFRYVLPPMLCSSDWPKMHMQTWSPHKGDEISNSGFDFPGISEKTQTKISPKNVLHYDIFLAVLKLKSHCINKTQLFIVIKETHLVVASHQMFSLKGKQFSR